MLVLNAAIAATSPLHAGLFFLLYRTVVVMCFLPVISGFVIETFLSHLLYLEGTSCARARTLERECM